MQPRTLWLTRSQPGADRQAAELEAHGHQVVAEPVLEIEALPGPPPAAGADVVVFLSEHAVACAGDLGFCTAARVLAVGERTREVLAAQSVSATAASPASSEGLLALDALRQPAGKTVLVVAGVQGRSLLADELERRGARVIRHVCYRRVAAERVALDPAAVDIIVVASGDGFAATARVWFGAGGSARVPVLAPSERVANLGGKLGFSWVVACAGAGTDAILGGLEQIQAAAT